MIYWILLVLFEVLVFSAINFIAKKMVANRSGLAKKYNIGKVDEQDTEKMKEMIRKIIRTGKFEMSDEFDGYEVEIKAKEKCIDEVIIKSIMTKVRFHYKDGWNTQEIGWTEKSAKNDIVFFLSVLAVMAQLILVVITWFVSLYMMVNSYL